MTRNLILYVNVTAILLWLSVPVAGHSRQPLEDSAKARQQHISRLTDTARQLEKKGNKDSALAYHNRALQKSKEYHLPEQQARSLLNIALLLKEDDVNKSLEHLHAAMDIAVQIKHKALQSDIYLAMSEIYRHQQNYGEALYALKEHHQLLADLLAENKARELAQLQSAYEVKMERRLWIAVLAAAFLIMIILGFYFYKTRKLNKALQISNMVKDKLFSILGHDLRGPAGNIAQSISLLKANTLSQENYQKLIALLETQSGALYDTLNSLLEWAHTQLRGVQPRPSLFNAKEVIHKNIEVLSGQAEKKEIIIEDNTPDALSVFTDQHHFDITIRNLLSNAIKFSHSGDTITIGSEEKKDEIVFSVMDKGIGISTARQKQLNAGGIDITFGTKGEKGTGLGLQLIRELIQSDGGRIWLTSEEGKGTIFYFSIKKRN